MIIIDTILVLLYKYLCGGTKYTKPLISSRPLASTGPWILASNTILPEKKKTELLGEQADSRNGEWKLYEELVASYKSTRSEHVPKKNKNKTQFSKYVREHKIHLKMFSMATSESV